jgi:hypothetical protein
MQKTKHILIDMENICPNMGSLKPKDRVIVFVGSKQSSINLELAKALQPLGDKVSYIKIGLGGKNALDFILAAKVGEIFAKDAKHSVVICSRDTGFDALVEHFSKQGCAITRSEEGLNKTKSPNEEMLENLVSRLKNMDRNRPASITGLSNMIKSSFRQNPTKIIKWLTDQKIITVTNNKITYRLA